MMKRLSPTEPLFAITLTLDVPPSLSASRIEKKLRVNYGFKTKFIGESSIKATLYANIGEYRNALSKILELSRDLRSGTNNAITSCIEYRVVLRKEHCPCRNKAVVIGDRVVCLESINDRLVYVYCNKSRGYVSIKFAQTPIKFPVDPLQIPSTAFLLCTDLGKISEYIAKVEHDLKVAATLLVTSAGDERPIR